MNITQPTLNSEWIVNFLLIIISSFVLINSWHFVEKLLIILVILIIYFTMNNEYFSIAIRN